MQAWRIVITVITFTMITASMHRITWSPLQQPIAMVQWRRSRQLAAKYDWLWLVNVFACEARFQLELGICWSCVRKAVDVVQAFDWNVLGAQPSTELIWLIITATSVFRVPMIRYFLGRAHQHRLRQRGLCDLLFRFSSSWQNDLAVFLLPG